MGRQSKLRQAERVMEQLKKRIEQDKAYMDEAEDIDMTLDLQALSRRTPLGMDRELRQYYWWPEMPACLFVCDVRWENWGYYDSEAAVRQLYAYLNDKGIRERHLRHRLADIFPRMARVFAEAPV